MSQHTPVPPDDCASCVELFSQLTAHAAAGGGRLTAAKLSDRTNLGERALRVHLAHLETHSRIESDRRTPVPGATVGAATDTPTQQIVTPLDWVMTVSCRDKTCRRMLIVLATHADAAWSGQLGCEQLAQALGCSLRTAKTHRAHLIEDGWVRTLRAQTHRPSGYVGREYDRYVLQSGLLAPQGETWSEDVALDALARVGWWRGASGKETQQAKWAILARLRAGWPAHVLVQRLDIVPARGSVSTRIGLLRSLLPDRDERYGVPALEAATGVPAGPVVCASCGTQFARTAQARPGQICRTCREEASGAGPDPGPPAFFAHTHAGTYGTAF